MKFLWDLTDANCSVLTDFLRDLYSGKIFAFDTFVFTQNRCALSKEQQKLTDDGQIDWYCGFD